MFFDGFIAKIFSSAARRDHSLLLAAELLPYSPDIWGNNLAMASEAE
jgi:hypothetical protein